MGKKLIIKGADFSQNGIISEVITWYNDYSDSVLDANTVFNSDLRLYMLASDLSRVNLLNKTVRYMKLYAKQAGIILFSTYSGSGASVSGETQYTVAQGVNIITLASPITIDSTHLPTFSGYDILSFWNDNNDAKGWNFGRVNASSSFASYRIPISFGAVV